LGVDPAFYAVNPDLDPYVSVYPERDRFGILIPDDWRAGSAGFEVFDLAWRLYDYLLGREAIIGLASGKRPTHVG